MGDTFSHPYLPQSRLLQKGTYFGRARPLGIPIAVASPFCQHVEARLHGEDKEASVVFRVAHEKVTPHLVSLWNPRLSSVVNTGDRQRTTRKSSGRLKWEIIRKEPGT
jgi:hypothetical protein